MTGSAGWIPGYSVKGLTIRYPASSARGVEDALETAVEPEALNKHYDACAVSATSRDVYRQLWPVFPQATAYSKEHCGGRTVLGDSSFGRHFSSEVSKRLGVRRDHPIENDLVRARICGGINVENEDPAGNTSGRLHAGL